MNTNLEIDIFTKKLKEELELLLTERELTKRLKEVIISSFKEKIVFKKGSPEGLADYIVDKEVINMFSEVLLEHIQHDKDLPKEVAVYIIDNYSNAFIDKIVNSLTGKLVSEN